MTTTDDMDLLREYATRNSEPAFTTLVSRHVDMVYSVALRRVGNHHQAEEITQAVFVILAKKAGSLRRGTVLSGWLFHTARLTAANFVRTEIRRTRREQEAFMQSNVDVEENQTEVWQQIAPLLDDAIADLGEKDRNAVVLRFVKGKDYPEVGAVLGASAEAAQVRISRAVEKLRKIFSKRGVVLSGVALSGAISAHAIQAAPVGLAVSATAMAIHGTALTASTLTLVNGGLKFMAWTKVNFAVGAGIAVLLAYQWHANTVQARQIASVQEQLKRTTRAFESQEASINTLQQQNVAMVEETRGQEQALQQLRVRQQAAATAKTSHATTGNRTATSVLSAQLADPVAREALHQHFMGVAKTRYSAMSRELKLSPEDAEKFYAIWADSGVQNLDTTTAVNEGRMPAAEAQHVDWTNRVHDLLGDENFAQFTEYNSNFPGRTLIDQLQGQLGNDLLNDDQRKRLLAIIRTEPFATTAALAGDFDIHSLSSQEELEKRYQRQTETSRRILEQAAGFLTPEQLEALGTMHTNIMNRQKVEGARTVKKF